MAATSRPPGADMPRLRDETGEKPPATLAWAAAAAAAATSEAEVTWKACTSALVFVVPGACVDNAGAGGPSQIAVEPKPGV